MLVAGIDVGTITTKVILLSDGQVLGSRERATTTNPETLARNMLGRLLVLHGYPQGAHAFAISTGQGRKKIRFADAERTEYLSLAKGAHHLRPGTRLVVDIGGMGIRIVQLDELGIMMNFTSNDKCSAGTGCFIDTMAYAMGLEHDQLSFMEVPEDRAASIHTTCTIFAESEVISLIAKGTDKKEIVAGLYKMVARKTAMLVRGAGMMGAAFVAGGVARNPGIIRALEEELHAPAYVPPEPHNIQAMGAALLPPKKQETPKNFFGPVHEEDGADGLDMDSLDAYHPSAPSVLVKGDEGGLTLAELSDEEEFAIAGPVGGPGSAPDATGVCEVKGDAGDSTSVAVPTPAPTAAPSVTPTAASKVAPTPAPSVTPTAASKVAPTPAPSVTPTAASTVAPTAAPVARAPDGPTAPVAKVVPAEPGGTAPPGPVARKVKGGGSP